MITRKTLALMAQLSVPLVAPVQRAALRVIDVLIGGLIPWRSTYEHMPRTNHPSAMTPYFFHGAMFIEPPETPEAPMSSIKASRVLRDAIHDKWEKGVRVYKNDEQQVSVTVETIRCMLELVESLNTRVEALEGSKANGLISAVDEFLCGISSRAELRKALDAANDALTA